MECNDKQITRNMNRQEYYKLPSNIRGLRKAFGESQTDLASAIGVEKTAVSNYELGEKIPIRDVLIRIAKHYRITEDELVHGDYSDLKKMYNDEMLDQQQNIYIIDEKLPRVCSPKALENINFKQAYTLEEKIIKQESADLANDYMQKCFKYYSAAIDEKVIEASANLLRQIFLIGMITCWTKPESLGNV